MAASEDVAEGDGFVYDWTFFEPDGEHHPILRAALDGDIEEVRRLLSLGVSQVATIQYACCNDDTDGANIVQALLEAGGTRDHRRRRRDRWQPVALRPRVEHGYRPRELVEDVEDEEAAAINGA